MRVLLALLACMSLFTSCSVIMAAKKDGVSVNKLQTSRSRGELLACSPCIVSSDYSSNGQLVEVYQFQRERGSISRAMLHGVLDLSTGGLWEVIGTPMEIAVDQKEYFCIRVYYDHLEHVERIELL